MGRSTALTYDLRMAASRKHTHRRRTIRLPSYDYASPGAYFITLCTFRRLSIFSEVTSGSVRLSKLGEIARDELLRTESIRDEAEVDAFVIMPNHVHAIVLLRTTVGATGRSPLPRTADGPPPRSIGALVAGLKSATTTRINRLRGAPGSPVWQRNYYERVIRNEVELAYARQYIVDNPREWPGDPNNTARVKRPRSPRTGRSTLDISTHSG